MHTSQTTGNMAVIEEITEEITEEETPLEYCLAIVGSREMKLKSPVFQEGILQVIEQWGVPSSVVSGGARGADTIGEQWARDNNIPITVYKPDWKKHGRAAGMIRNADIIARATHILAFPSSTGSGTQDSIIRATRANKPVISLYI